MLKKNVKPALFVLLSVLFFLFFLSFYLRTEAKFVDAQINESEIVMEKNSKRVLFGKNVSDKMFMASTTKILTAITIIENCDVNALVTVTPETVGVEGSSIYLEAGEKLSVKDLLYGLMLRSGNDCAETLAVYCSETISAFAGLMNETAAKIGAKNSNFVNPHGLHDDNHYTTAYDLALISCYALDNPVFREIASAKTAVIPHSTRDGKRYLKNKNKMLSRLDGCTGIKTGYTKKAGRCLVTSCERDGMELVCVVLNCGAMWDVSENLLNDAFLKYHNYKLADEKNVVGFAEYGEKSKKCPLYIKNDIVLPLTKTEKERLKIVYDYEKKLDKNFKKDEEVGSVKIFIENNLLFSEKIYTILGVRN